MKQVFVLVGHPVLHSLSPAIHQEAYRALGVDHTYRLVDCPSPDDVRAVIGQLRRGEIAGANVTVPWKRLALELADDLDPSASATGAANVLRPSGSNGSCRVVAHNTDVPALSEELRRGRPDARTATVIGNGGAALAAVVACRGLGMERIWAVARGFRGDGPWHGAKELRERGATPVPWPEVSESQSTFGAAIRESDVVVQSTSDGMHGGSDGTTVRDLVPWADLRRDAFVYDVVYNPSVTPFVRAAMSAGIQSKTGLGMLVGQATLAIELWLGERPEEAPLRLSAERALAERNRR